MFDEKIFELKARKKIYEFIMENPGLHFREIARNLNIPNSTLRYHLNYLKKRGYLTHEFENGYSRYYIVQNVSANDKKLINILRETVPRNIILYLTLYPYSSQTDVRNFVNKWRQHPSKIGYYLDKHHTTLGFHLKKLIEEEIIDCSEEGTEIKYTLKNPEEVIDLLIRYDKTLLEEAYGRVLKWVEDPNDNINAVIDLFFDIFPIHFRC